MLSKTFSGVPAALMERMVKTKLTGKIRRDAYPPELRAFALTLHFYSAKAYRYVRKSFDLSLPHPSVIRRWYSGISGEPGFTQEAFAALEVKVEEANKRGESVVCALMLDEMAIKQHIDWDGHKYYGYVDIGVGVEDDTTPAARDALVFMVVALNSNWKLPIAYFLIDGMSGKERANLVEQSLVRLKDVGVHCVSLTCDGPSCHFTMLEELGASMTPPNLEPSFPHPADNNHRVYVLLDICHMLKLIRNTLASGQVITSPGGQKISWTPIAELHKLQEEQGLRLGNKLRASHIQWHRQKMKVNLAAQTISSSVADAIEFCSKELKLPQFRGSDATVEFIRIIDRLFDLMNSWNPLGRHYKAPLKKENESKWRDFLQQAYTYLSQLTHNNGEPMHCSRKKTPFIGFMAGIRSMQGLFDSLVKCEAPKLKYLLTYKLSQDHLELFFCAVRAANGSNNNPTAHQFASTYKRLLVRHEIQGQNGNCTAQGKTPILFVSSAKPCIKTGNLNEELADRDILLLRKYDLEERQPCKVEHEYCDAPNISELSSVKLAAVGYIAGYVVRMAKRRTACPECQAALTSDKVDAGGGLLMRKNRGGLIKPSEDVVRVCNSTERCFQRLLHTTQGALPQSHGISFALATAVLHDVAGKQIFVELSDHMFDGPPDYNHVFVLIKCIASCYVKIRMHHLAKCCNEKLGGPKIRKQLSKLILFKHQ